MPAMPRITWQATYGLLAILLLTSPGPVKCLIDNQLQINSFEVNWNEFLNKGRAWSVQSADFSPPPSDKSSFKWVPSTFGPCYGCGSRSHKAVTHDCVHRLPMQLTVGNYSKPLMGVFKVPDTECVKRGINASAPVERLGCGPPCSELRLLRGGATGCRCDHSRKLAYDVPKLVCQNNKNRTVSLALCKYMYEDNKLEYQAFVFDYSVACSRSITWIAGNWTQCSHDNPVYQSRKIVCAAQSQTLQVYFVMHDSMCPADRRPPKMQPCARWTAERRFTCQCSTRLATRRVLCMGELYGRRRPVLEAECSWHAKPEVSRSCDRSQLAKCGLA